MSRNQKIIFAIIILLAAFLIFFRLGRQDMLGDDGHYAMRAFGYLDYMASRMQTTPLQWFGQRPGWSYLSFHDHPPLYFFIQHVFFKLFGASVAVSRLTSALAGMASVIVMFFFARRLRGIGFGLLSAAALVLNNYFIWTGRIGNLESFFIFWLLLAFLHMHKALTENSKNFIWAGLFFGLAMLTKYTLLFFLPAVFLYLLWRERRVFREKKFWLGVAVFVLAISPLLIYNLNMYHSRGHFDVQWSDFFGQQHEDWPILGSRVGGWHFNAGEVAKKLGDGLSWPYFALALAGLGVAVFRARKESWLLLVALAFAFPFLFFSYIGAASHWLGVMSPFAALLAAAALEPILRQRAARWLLVLPAAYFLVVIWNTNHALLAPQNPWLHSAVRMENSGYNQLDEAMTKLVSGKTVPLATREIVKDFWFGGIKEKALPFMKEWNSGEVFNSLIVYDANTTWFPAVWTFGRLRTYYGVPVIDSSEFGLVMRDENSRAVFETLNFDRVYYIQGSESVNALSAQNHPESSIILDEYKKRGSVPEVIRDLQGREAFYIY